MDLNKLKEICLKDNIPIIRDNTLKFINEMIDKYHFNSILEIGTAYGYSAYAFSKNKNINKITTIEIRKDNFLKAKKYLKGTNIQLINADALEYYPNDKFDLIFMDGAKSHQDLMFNHVINFLNSKGMIVIDNIFLKKFNNLKTLTKNQEKLIKKVNDFKQWLLNLQDYKAIIKDLDDGIAIITKK